MLIELQKFNPDDYYRYFPPFTTDFVQPNDDGLNLVIQYHQWKYGTNITLLRADLTELAAKIKEIRDNATNKDDYRHAFVYGRSTVHSTSIIYIKENNKEILFVPESVKKIRRIYS